MYLPSLDGYDLALLLVSLGLLFVGFVVYPVEPFRTLTLFVVFCFYLAWMAYVLQKWMFEGESR